MVKNKETFLNKYNIKFGIINFAGVDGFGETYGPNNKKYLDEISSKRKTMVSSGDRSAKIRTYNYPQGRVTDHRIKLTLYNLQNIVNGDLDEIIEKLQIAENAEKLKESGMN